MANNRISTETIEVALMAIADERAAVDRSDNAGIDHQPLPVVSKVSKKFLGYKHGDSHFAGHLLMRYLENPEKNYWMLAEAESVVLGL